MSSSTGRLRKTAAVLPLALLSAAWTASLAGVGFNPVSSAAPSTSAPDGSGRLPDGSRVPTVPFDDPASVSAPDEDAGSVTGVNGDAQQIAATSSTNGIPSAALAAYQRAETVINAADPGCKLTWQLVAAIGRVESNHGRFGGSALDSDGVATPAITGIALDGRNGTTVIRDTDAGQYDGDRSFDRAVGPMQFIPSTWAQVGVDADGDGERNPQDIDDAALGTAVYLCSGDDDLSTLSGQRDAVFRYNNSESYVDLVLSVMDAYLGGDYMSVPDDTADAGYLTPGPSIDLGDLRDRGRDRGDDRPGPAPTAPSPTAEPTQEPTTDPTQPSEPTEPTEPTQPEPTDPSTPKPPKPPTPTNTPDLPDVDEVVPDVPDTGVPPVDDTISKAEATTTCLAQLGFDSVADLLTAAVLKPDLPAKLDACVAKLVG
ncbi:hypothetical protein GCM10023340_13330 [Nocardioides marinquilinus]|uniref:Transglycosylase SLT domain-containing protein n=1 Tax=Nocardioides marinquilinus TaxID=1210400 RepID=A0ABP9PDN6_9ACTN